MKYQRVYDALYYFDWFSKPVSLNFRSKNAYHTLTGAVVTIIILTLMFSYFIVMLVEPLEIKTPDSVSFSNVQLYGNMDTSNNTKMIFENGLIVAVGLENGTFDDANLSIAFEILYLNNQDNTDYSIQINVSTWQSSMFPSDLESDLSEIGVFNQFLWLERDNVLEQHNTVNDSEYTFQAVIAKFTTWLDNNTCQSSTTVRNTYNNTSLLVHFFEGYVDPYDSQSGIKYYFNTQNQIPIYLGGKRRHNFYIKTNTLRNPNGSILQYENLSEKQFFEYFDNQNILSTEIYIHAHESYDYYEILHENGSNSEGDAKLMSGGYFMFFFMSQLGGLFTFFKLLMYPLMNYLTSWSFEYATINEVFLYQSPKPPQTEQTEQTNNKKRSKIERNKSRSPQTESIPLILKKEDNNKKFFKKLNEMNEGGEQEGEIQRRRNDQSFRYYKTKDIWKHQFDLIFKCKKSKKKLVFDKELKIFNEECDMVRIIMSINQIKIKLEELNYEIQSTKTMWMSLSNDQGYSSNNQGLNKHDNPNSQEHPRFGSAKSSHIILSDANNMKPRLSSRNAIK